MLGPSPGIKVVLEHITIPPHYVLAGPERLAASIIVHHLMVKRNAQGPDTVLTWYSITDAAGSSFSTDEEQRSQPENRMAARRCLKMSNYVSYQENFDGQRPKTQ